MIETMIKIMVELLTVLAIATKQINQGRLEKFARKLLGEKGFESVLQRLDRLTLEESKMTVAQTLDVVYGLVNNMEVVMEDGKTSTDDIRESLVLMQEMAMKVNKIERDQLREKILAWLSPPDPWTNYNTARRAHHPGTATWFTQGDMFGKWKSTGSLLWVNGLPGSGKTIFSSSIIKDIQDMCQTGLAILAIFYFHFGDNTKQDVRNLLSSVLFQLCSQSDQFSQVLSSIYLSHNNGSRQPSIDALLDCLKTILTLQGQAPLYIVVDALDECPNSSGLRTQRQEVLEVVKELMELRHPCLHFCVTSRPEIDIRRAFDPLNHCNVSLHDQDGQIKDLNEYVKAVVGSDGVMQNWPEKVKELVIDTLTRKGGGMFRWAYCQLETLRQCPLRYIPSTLNELPETLDETYERILQGIPKKMQKDAHCILQWLTVSLRPLRVEEVAEVFAINFDEEVSGIPEFEPSWRDPNAEIAVLSACSTLVAIVSAGWDGKIVQFSHFSVKEYLTSNRIVHAEHVSHFQIYPKPAHTLLAKACLSVLLQLDYSIDEVKIKNFPLAEYAAKHWVEHAQFEDVASYIGDGMDLLFDKEKPYFACWVWLYNRDEYRHYRRHTTRPEKPGAAPLYYAALCGFSSLVERLLTAHPQDLDAEGGIYGAPLNAALMKGHLNIALFLLDHNADGDNRSKEDQTGLYIASSRGYADVLQSLIDHGADLNAICKDCDECLNEMKWTPLHMAISSKRRDIAILLLDGGADTEILSSLNQTALYIASSRGYIDAVRLLIDRGADLNAECQDWIDGFFDLKWTSLHVAIYKEHQDIARLLLKRGADTETRSTRGETAFYVAWSRGCADIVQQVIKHDVDLNALKSTSLHMVSLACYGIPPIARMLLEHGANPNAPDSLGITALHLASRSGVITHVEFLLECGANVDVRDKEGWIPLHEAAYNVNLQVVKVLLNRGADPHAQTNNGETPIQLANAPYFLDWEENQAHIIRLLSERTGETMHGLQ